MVSSYESRFLQVRSIIEKQDAELRAANANLQTVREQLASQEDIARTLSGRLEDLQKDHKEQIVEIQEKVGA